MKKNFIYLFFLVLLAAGCSKEKSIDTTGGTNNGGSGGSGGGSGTGTDTYQPFTKDSYWKYDQTGDMPSVFTITSTGTKQPSGGIDYYLFKSAQPAGTVDGLFGIKDHKYYTKTQASGPSSGNVDITMLYLNDTASVGYSIQHIAGQVNGFDIKMPMSIIGKGLTITVRGKTFNDVIHSRILLQYDLPILGTTTFVTYDYYVAKNIGIVKIESTGDDTFGGGVETLTELTEYSIK